MRRKLAVSASLAAVCGLAFVLLGAACGGGGDGTTSPTAQRSPGAPGTTTTSPIAATAVGAGGPCGLATPEEMSKASTLSLVKAAAVGTVCSYTGSNGTGGNAQIKTMTGAEYDTEATTDQSDGTGYTPISGLGVAAFEGAGGLYVKADGTHALQIYLIGSGFVNNGPALRAAESAVANLLLSRLVKTP